MNDDDKAKYVAFLRSLADSLENAHVHDANVTIKNHFVEVRDHRIGIRKVPDGWQTVDISITARGVSADEVHRDALSTSRAKALSRT